MSTLILVILILWIGYRIFFRIITVNRYEYLELLSFHEWKSGRELRKEMEHKKNGRISGPQFYQNMSRLEEEKLVEGKMEEEYVLGYMLKKRFYRLISEGGKKREELLSDSKPAPALLPHAT